MVNRTSRFGDLQKAIDDGINARTANLLKSDMSNLTSQAEKKFLEGIKQSILDSSSFREEVAKSVVDLVNQMQRRIVWYWIKLIGAIIGWGIGALIALAQVSDAVKVWVLRLIG